MSTRDLRSYRPQHDEDCRSRCCVARQATHGLSCQKSKGAWEHTAEREGWGGSYHKFVAGDCTCGLDALLAQPLEPELRAAFEAGWEMALDRFQSIAAERIDGVPATAPNIKSAFDVYLAKVAQEPK